MLLGKGIYRISDYQSFLQVFGIFSEERVPGLQGSGLFPGTQGMLKQHLPWWALVPAWRTLQAQGGLTACRWLLTDGPIYIQGGYYAWNHSSIICFREFNQSIFQFHSDSGSDRHEGSQVGFILGQCYLPAYLQQIHLKSTALIICEKNPFMVPLWSTREALVWLKKEMGRNHFRTRFTSNDSHCMEIHLNR